MTVFLYGLKVCSTCRTALKKLKEMGIEVSFIDVRNEGIERDKLIKYIEELGDVLLNRRSTTWRGLSDEQRKENLLDLLLRHPSLMKRPLIDANGRLSLGWNDNVIKGLRDHQ